jgi:hypothetical protein
VRVLLLSPPKAPNPSPSLAPGLSPPPLRFFSPQGSSFLSKPRRTGAIAAGSCARHGGLCAGLSEEVALPLSSGSFAGRSRTRDAYFDPEHEVFNEQFASSPATPSIPELIRLAVEPLGEHRLISTPILLFPVCAALRSLSWRPGPCCCCASLHAHVYTLFLELAASASLGRWHILCSSAASWVRID